jgi:hypothetical protein
MSGNRLDFGELDSKEKGEDAAFFLYLAPVVASIIYGVYEWLSFGPRSYSMPPFAYVVVAKNQYLFLGSIVAICLGFVLEIRSTPFSERTNVVSANSARMQLLAIIVLIISFAAAISAGGYNVAAGAGDFLTGRYALIFAFFLIVFSILISPRQLLGNVKTGQLPEFIGLILMALSPFVYYGATKVKAPFPVAGAAGIVVLIVGIAILVAGNRMFRRTRRVVKAQVTAQAPSQ